MRKLRKEDLSLHHYLRFNVLDQYIETEEDISLTYLSDVSEAGSYVYEAESTRLPSPTSLGRGWVYLDNYGDTTEQQAAVTVYDSGNSVISGTNYMIDYVDGRVIFASQSIVPATVSYQYFYVSLVNEWQDVEAADVPVVVVNLEGFEKEGFQLGGGKKPIRRGRLHIFATNQAERDDLTELLYDGIYEKCVPNQEWPQGTILDWDGTFSNYYTYEAVEYESNLHITNVISRNVNPPLMAGIPRRDMTMLSDLNRYRARIDFDMFYWKEN